MEKEQTNILSVYIVFTAAVIMNCIPSTVISTLGFILLFVILIAIYVYRARSDKDSLRYSHMAFLIKSFWVSSLLLLIGMIAAYFLGDHSSVINAYESIFKGSYLTEEQINNILSTYLHDNLTVFLLTLGPSLLYLAYRIYRGVMLIKSNLPIPNPKNWF